MLHSPFTMLRISAIATLVLALLGVTTPVRAVTVQADRVIVLKKERIMMLLRDGEVLKRYRVALGRQPVGHKSRQGDNRTPEGIYTVDARIDRSRFHRALHISYPNAADIAAARRHGTDPGGDIMIHGLPRGFEDLAESHVTRNWTKGCIAVSNAEIDEIWRLVPDGTSIEIRP